MICHLNVVRNFCAIVTLISGGIGLHIVVCSTFLLASLLIRVADQDYPEIQNVYSS